MTIRKSNDISNDPNINARLKTDTAKADILERYNVTKTDNILPCDEGLAYLSEKIDECIDVINTNEGKTGISDAQTAAITANTAKTGITTGQANAITANTAKTGISTSQASAITANTRKVGTETDLSVTEDLTVLATVTENRGTYTLTFTMRTADGRTTKTADITMR